VTINATRFDPYWQSSCCTIQKKIKKNFIISSKKPEDRPYSSKHVVLNIVYCLNYYIYLQ